MRTISIINLKGGVAKTVSAINIAHILATVYNKRVLLIDNDKQGNTSKFFGLHSYDKKTISNLLTDSITSIEQVINPTQYENLYLIPANMELLNGNNMLVVDTSITRNYRLKKAIATVIERFDYCIIDNPPDINMEVINALVATDDVLVPIKADKFAFDGMDFLIKQVEDIKAINPNIKLLGCFVTMYTKSKVSQQANDFLHNNTSYPLFDTSIRKTVKVDEMTFSNIPLLEYAPKCTATKDYLSLTAEYLKKVSVSDTI